ncbi:hypothetical protein ACF1A5_26175 [Streptomyces sp. NPDC014864]|uniref:hypothetical protein n=1 Tax=Streptomyces sp. NPDC014864 TaxID=3364924 RepID=UPI00370020B8
MAERLRVRYPETGLIDFDYEAPFSPADDQWLPIFMAAPTTHSAVALDLLRVVGPETDTPPPPMIRA